MSALIGISKPVNGAHKEPPLPAERCGNCRYHAPQPQDPRMIMCQGGPPTAVMVGMTQDALGRPNPQMLSFWPSLQASQRRCALWSKETVVDGVTTQ